MSAASVVFLILVLLTWTIQAIQNGFDMSLIPAFGSNMSVSIPNILFNFSEFFRISIKRKNLMVKKALANTVPSVVNVMVR